MMHPTRKQPASGLREAFIWGLYQGLFLIGFTLLLPHFLLRMRKRGGYTRNFSQRFGCYAPELRALWNQPDRPIWLHAVSVGELLVGLRLLETLRTREPALRFVVSVTTSTACRIAEKRLQAPDAVIYFPLDLPFIIRRVLNRIRPRTILLVEGEWWPNLLRTAAAQDIPVQLVNARLSDRSFKRYQHVHFLTRRVLPLLSGIHVQGQQERERFIALGAEPDHVHVQGNAKWDLPRPDPEAEAVARETLAQLGWPVDRLILLGGSTWPGEETALTDLYVRLRTSIPTLRLVLLPRHAERANDILRELEPRGQSIARRTQPGAQTDADILLVDTTGEAMGFYAAADLVFVGKSLTHHGGQNPIEPAALGKPVLVGPNMENFRGVMDDLLRNEAIIQAPDASALEQHIRQLLDDPHARNQLGQRAAETVRAQAGVIDRTTAACL